MQRFIKDRDDLQRYLSPANLAGREQWEYRLGAFKSRIAMELLQVAVRKQSMVFGFDDELVAANVDVDAKLLHVDVRRMNSLNDQIQDRASRDKVFQIRLLQRFHACRQRLEQAALRFQNSLQRGEPTSDELIEYFDLVTSYQELGVLKFSFPERMARRAIAALLRGDQQQLRELLRPQGVSLFYELYVERLKLAHSRLAQTSDRYQRDLQQFRERFGFLGAEDMDFAEHDTLEQLDAEIQKIVRLYQADAEAIRQRLDELDQQSAAAQADRRGAWNAFYEFANRSESRLDCLNLLALSEQLISHEESNRFSKMRFLRDIRLLLDRRGVDVYRASLVELLRPTVATCGNSAC